MGGPPSTSPLTLFIISLLASAVNSQTFLELLPGAPPHGATSDGDGIYCESWNFSVETNDAGIWWRVPSRCLGFVKDYMTGPRYPTTCDVVSGDALDYAQTAEALRGGGAGKRTWIFDVDETLLSNLPYYRANGFGSELFNETSFDEWVDLAIAPAIPASLGLYNQLQQLGFRLVLLTGRSDHQRDATEKNLLFAGYRNWEMLILRKRGLSELDDLRGLYSEQKSIFVDSELMSINAKDEFTVYKEVHRVFLRAFQSLEEYWHNSLGPSDLGKTAVLYKSEKRAWLASQGYKIYGSSGDQWSDLIGAPMAKRSFKLPNPMYYIE